MLSKATPLLLTASPKITLHWSDGLLCILFPYSLYPIQLITEVHECSPLVEHNNRIDGYPRYPSLTSISDTVVRTVEKWTRQLYVVVFCILVKERVHSYRYSTRWILCLYQQHWATAMCSHCASTPFSLCIGLKYLYMKV